MKLIKFVSIASAAMMIWSCQKEEIDVTGDDNSNLTTENVEIKSLMGITNFPVVKIDKDTYSHGDIRLFEGNFDNPESAGKQLTPQTPEVGALAIGGRVRKWPNNTVIYRKSGLSARVNGEVDKAMAEWTAKTNVRFKQHTNESFYVTIREDGSGCNCGNANLGVNGTRGRINLGSRSSASLIVHEIGHTLGYIHEQNRADRDDVINVNFDNISQRGASQYFKSNNANSLTDQLDPLSTMMYSSNTFGNGNGPTMTFKDGSRLPRKPGGLSAGDIAGTNRAYPGDNTGGGDPTDPVVTPPTNPQDACAGVPAWSRNRRYRVGDRVTFRGYLFERDFSRWNLLQKCGAPARDICEGIEPYNGGSYNVGDKVTFRGDLYRRVNGGWIKEGQCNS